MFGWTEFLFIAALVVIVFNARKWPAVGRAMRDSVMGFRKGLQGKAEDERRVRDVTPANSSEEKPKKS